MKNLKKTVKDIVKDALSKYQKENKKVREFAAERSRYNPDYYNEKKAEMEAARDAILKAAQKQIDAHVSAFNEQFHDKLDASQITDDVKLLNCGLKLSAEDLHDIFDRSKGNPTMQMLVQRYANDNQVHGYNRQYVTAAMKREHVEGLSKIAKNAFSRPDWVDSWTSDEYWETAVSDEIPG